MTKSEAQAKLNTLDRMLKNVKVSDMSKADQKWAADLYVELVTVLNSSEA